MPPNPNRPHFEVSIIVENVDGEITEVFEAAQDAATRVAALKQKGQFVNHAGTEINTDYVVTVQTRPGKKVPESE